MSDAGHAFLLRHPNGKTYFGGFYRRLSGSLDYVTAVSLSLRDHEVVRAAQAMSLPESRTTLTMAASQPHPRTVLLFLANACKVDRRLTIVARDSTTGEQRLQTVELPAGRSRWHDTQLPVRFNSLALALDGVVSEFGRVRVTHGDREFLALRIFHFPETHHVVAPPCGV